MSRPAPCVARSPVPLYLERVSHRDTMGVHGGDAEGTLRSCLAAAVKEIGSPEAARSVAVGVLLAG